MKIKNLPKIKEGNFKKVIDSAMAKGRHVDYLQEVLKNYEWYKSEFAKVFNNNGKADLVYVFRVAYEGKLNLWREIEILGNQTFEELAEIIISGMRWYNDHMHGFTIPGIEKKPEGNSEFGPTTRLDFFAPGWEDDPFPTYKSNQIKICQIDYSKYLTIDFIFDFGDGHEFKIIYKGTRDIKSSERKIMFPAITDQRGAAPKQYPSCK